MKLIRFILFVLVLFPALCFGDMNPYIAGQTVASGGSPVSTMLFFMTFEGTWSDPTYTAGSEDFIPSGGDNTATATGAVDITIGAKKIGSYGLTAPTGTDYFTFSTSSDDNISGSAGIVAFWLYIDTWYDYTRLFRAYESDTDRFYIVYRGSDDAAEIRLYWEEGDNQQYFTTTGAAIANDTWVFAEVIYDASQAGGSDTLNIKVDNVSRYSSSALTLTPITSIIQMDVGTTPVGGDGGIFMDNIMSFDSTSANAYQYRNNTSYPTE